MKDPHGNITIEGFYDNIVPPTKLEREMARQLSLESEDVKRMLGLQKLDAPVDRPFADRLMFHPTLTINGFQGGYGGPGSKTVLPHKAVVKCDARIVEEQTPEYVLAKIEAHVKRHAPDVEFIAQEAMLPSKTRLDSPYSDLVYRAVCLGQGLEPLIYPSAGGSLPDYVFTKVLGIDAFGVPYANADEDNHAPNENITIECFLKGIRTGAALLDVLGARSAE